jgi:hypothetical protein
MEGQVEGWQYVDERRQNATQTESRRAPQAEPDADRKEEAAETDELQCLIICEGVCREEWNLKAPLPPRMRAWNAEEVIWTIAWMDG